MIHTIITTAGLIGLSLLALFIIVFGLEQLGLIVVRHLKRTNSLRCFYLDFLDTFHRRVWARKHRPYLRNQTRQFRRQLARRMALNGV